MCVRVYIARISKSACQSSHRRNVKKLGGRSVTHGKLEVWRPSSHKYINPAAVLPGSLAELLKSRCRGCCRN